MSDSQRMVDLMRHLPLGATIVLCACAAPAATAPVPDRAFATFRQELETVRTTLRIPGMTAAIVSGDSIVWRASSGFADLDARIAMHDTTAFPVASLTKTMTAALVLGLAREGRLGLDSLVPLLSHTSEGRAGEEYHVQRLSLQPAG